MKKYLIYGFLTAFASFLLALVLFLTGFQTDTDKLQAGMAIDQWVGFAILCTGIVLGTRARRSEAPPTEPFGYGRAFGAGMAVAAVATVFRAAFGLLYTGVINPRLADLMLEMQVGKLQARGLSQDQIDKAEKIMRVVMSPIPMAMSVLIFGLIFGALAALVVAAIVKRPAAPPTVWPSRHRVVGQVGDRNGGQVGDLAYSSVARSAARGGPGAAIPSPAGR